VRGCDVVSDIAVQLGRDRLIVNPASRIARVVHMIPLQRCSKQPAAFAALIVVAQHLCVEPWLLTVAG